MRDLIKKLERLEGKDDGDFDDNMRTAARMLDGVSAMALETGAWEDAGESKSDIAKAGKLSDRLVALRNKALKGGGNRGTVDAELDLDIDADQYEGRPFMYAHDMLRRGLGMYLDSDVWADNGVSGANLKLAQEIEKEARAIAADLEKAAKGV